MTEKTGKLESWALNLIIAIIAAVIAFGGQLVSSGNPISGIAFILAVVFLIWGAIGYLLTKRRG